MISYSSYGNGSADEGTFKLLVLSKIVLFGENGSRPSISGKNHRNHSDASIKDIRLICIPLHVKTPDRFPYSVCSDSVFHVGPTL